MEASCHSARLERCALRICHSRDRFVLGKFPDMEHGEPCMAHVGPGQQGEIIWRFNQAGEFDFACLIPGHYQAGMKGRIVVHS